MYTTIGTYNRYEFSYTHNLFLVHFVNLYMFRAYLGPSSGGTAVCIQHLVRIISTNCCIHYN